jgi:eukaryotic-like serine/threonine-protein kinase
MALTAGTKLGPYEVQSPLGAGGMGEVYRARDTRLDRTVAVKILPTHLCENPEFKQRFEREARTISSLNHPHICHLFDIGSQEGTDFLVMEFLDGETLVERLRKGAVPLNELLKVGIEVAEALEVAHRAGIVHRDLKPGNIMLTKSGAKLMDFGLAKPTPLGTSGVGSAPLLSAARTMSGPSPASPLTTAGSIVGTIQYMSPEQIEGKEADARSDIFAFGAVLYEMATGKRAFQGKSQISVASAILEKDPEPISTTKPLTPATLDYLVATCLAKDREERLQSAHDVRLQLKGISLSSSSGAAITATRPSRRRRVGMLLASVALLLAGAGITYLMHPGGSSAPSVRSYIPPPPGTTFTLSGLEIGPVAVSPDGKTLAFSAVDEQGVTKLWLRPLNAQQATALAGTEDASKPFWSPEGQSLAFVADGKLKKVSASGGNSETIADGVGSESGGGTWSADGTILFCKERSGAIYRVAASGGEVSPATKLKETERSHDEPFFLPDGKHFLYAVTPWSSPREIRVSELGKPGQDGVAVVPGQMPQFASGRLVFSRDGHVMAQVFDAATWKVSGEPQTFGAARYFSVSTNGVLAYHESSAESELKIFDRGGNVVATPGPLALYDFPRFSPDGKSIAVTVTDPKSGTDDVWVYPAAGGQPARITFGPEDFYSVWSPDGKEIAYSVAENGKVSIRRRPLDGRHPEETLFTNDAYTIGIPIDWSRDGKYLSMHLSTKQDVFSNWSLPLAGGKAFRPAATAGLKASEYEGRFSFDSRWLTYFSYETGRPEVYVVPFPGEGSKSQVSTTGGWLARFSRNDLFYVTMANRLMVAQIHTAPTFGVDSIRPLFQLDFPDPQDRTSPLYDVSADGQRFAVLTADRTKSTSITLLTNWPAEFKK